MALSGGIDILASIEVLEAGNKPKVISELQKSDAGFTADLIRRSIFKDLGLRVARAYAPSRPGDRHLQRAFDLLRDAAVFSEVAQQGRSSFLRDACEHWRACRSDNRMQIIKHARDKWLAHLGTPTLPLPQIADFFDFCRLTTQAMELLAQGTGAVTLGLDSQMDVWQERASLFWSRWAAPSPEP